MAEEVGFEPTKGFPLPVFKTGAFNRSATLPGTSRGIVLQHAGAMSDARHRRCGGDCRTTRHLAAPDQAAAAGAAVDDS